MLRTAVCTVLALLAFAANSLLCRLALSTGGIDPASFTTIRLVTGAAVLLALVRLRAGAGAGRVGASGAGAGAGGSGGAGHTGGTGMGDMGAQGARAGGARTGAAGAGRAQAATPSWTSAALLALYAVPFSFAYRQLTAGTGALLLFAAVQLTMIVGGLRAGRRPSPRQWLGLLVAFGGLVYLVLPGLAAPPPLGATLMLVAGLAWGLYSLAGRASTDPLAQTAGNFARAVPWALALSALAWPRLVADGRGIALASLSGAVASGLGYVLWYGALPHLSPVVASMVQLVVPPLAALGGLLLVDEPLTARLALATAIILGGLAVALRPATRAPTTPRAAGQPRAAATRGVRRGR